jgi:hypothetical protein
MRFLILSAIVVAGLVLLAPPAPAASLAQSVSASANIGTLAKLAVSPASLLFADSDPDLVPSIPSATGPVTITAKARATAGATVLLALLATDDLRSGMDTIPISDLTWTAAGAGFVGGTASKSASQPVATWVNSGIRSGTQTFALANPWTRVTGTYSVSLVYTLTAP